MLYGLNRFDICDIFLSHKIIMVFHGLFMNWKSQIEFILINIDHENNWNSDILVEYYARTIQ